MERDLMMKSLKDTISNVLETMFFQPLQFLDDNCTLSEWFSQGQDLYGVSLNFNGSSKGSLSLLIPFRCVTEMTANFLGLQEEEVDKEQRNDTLKEALNMIVGSMLSLMDEEGPFKLGIPQIMDENALNDKVTGDVKGDFILFETGNSHAALGFVID